MPKTTPRAVVGTRVAGLLAGIAAAVVILIVAPLGLGILLGPSLVAGGLLLGTALGEVAVRRPAWDEQSTPSGPRVIASAVPRNLTIAVLVGIIAIAAALITTTALAAPSTTGGTRTLQAVCTSGATATATPWPGSYYSVPLTVIFASGVVIAAVAVVLAVRRPRGATVADGLDIARVRSLSARPIVESLVALVGLALGSVTLAAGTALVNLGCGSVVQRIIGWALLVVAIISLLAGLRYVARLALGPSGRQPRHGA